MTDFVKSLFLDLVQLDSHSLEEGNMAKRCRAELEQLGFSVVEDQAGETLGGQTGNLIATLPGDASRQPILLAAHMDTVQPGKHVKPRVDDDGVVWSDGTTILGADDKAGVVAILAGLRELKTSGAEHGTIQVVFTIAEEVGLQGARNLDTSQLKAKVGLSLDSGGQLGTLVVAGPAQVKWVADVKGKSAHAGVAPEKGISAIKVAAHAVARMPHGRIDNETTVNIGTFMGTGPTNVVRDSVRLIGEARSRNPGRLDSVLTAIDESFQSAALEAGASVHVEFDKRYDGFRFGEDAAVRILVEQALRKAGFEPLPTESGGGSDANIYTELGIPTMNIGIGYEEIHSTSEHVRLKDIEDAAHVVFEFCLLA
jgi:tripeptide aminopeptidase